MAYKVIMTDRGRCSLESILEDLAETSPEAAAKLDAEISRTIDMLETFPYLGAEYKPRRNRRKIRSVREIQYRSYRIFYHVRDESSEVSVMLVWHSSRHEPEI